MFVQSWIEIMCYYTSIVIIAIIILIIIPINIIIIICSVYESSICINAVSSNIQYTHTSK